MSVAAETEIRIDELARRSGMTVRNIRAHQSRGLLPPPEVRGRTGYYGAEHLERIALIRELQAEGLNLEAIKRLLGGDRPASRDVVDFARLLRAPFDDEEPEIVSMIEMGEIWGVTDPERGSELVRRSEELGFMRPIDSARVEVASPRLMAAAGELAALGVPAEEALDVLAFVRGHGESISRRYLDLFLSTVWAEFDRTGRPEAEWPRVIESLGRLRPQVTETVVAIFNMTMSETTEGALERLGFADRGVGGGAPPDGEAS